MFLCSGTTEQSPEKHDVFRLIEWNVFFSVVLAQELAAEFVSAGIWMHSVEALVANQKAQNSDAAIKCQGTHDIILKKVNVLGQGR